METEDLSAFINKLFFFSLNYQERNGKQIATNYIIKVANQMHCKNKTKYSVVVVFF